MNGSQKMKKLRRVGDITADMEKLLLELAIDHDMQWNEILGLTYLYLMVHCPKQREEYVAGGHPEFYYGPKRDK